MMLKSALFIISERKATKKHQVCHYSNSPYIHGWLSNRVIIRSHLRSYVIHGNTIIFVLLLISSRNSSDAEIDYFSEHSSLCFEYYIFQLQVAVNNAFVMALTDPTDNLTNNISGTQFIQTSFIYQIFQLSTSTALHYYYHIAIVLERLILFNNSSVVQLFHNRSFLIQVSHLLCVFSYK